MNLLTPKTRRGFAALLIALGLLAVPAVVNAVWIPERTLRASIGFDGSQADGPSQNPFLSSTGRVLALDTSATNVFEGDANGAVRDVVKIDLSTGGRRLISASPAEGGANGPSTAPVTSADGNRVVFVSEASNLVADDTNGVADLFVRDGGGDLVRVSLGADGVEANGPSYQPDLSENGRILTFTSDASNLDVDDTNNAPDVFVRDLDVGVTKRVSIGPEGQGNARSSQPAISADGKVIAFESGASNLVPEDTNGIADVFVIDLTRAELERVSISSNNRQQEKAVIPPFTQVPDISGDGRYVVFDSDSTRLVPNDTNGRTDVFMHDRTDSTTELISASTANVQGNNDSFAPRIVPDGEFVAFQSLATNLTPGDDGPREDIFVRDVKRDATSVVNVPNDGSARAPELVPQLLQRPVLSNDGRVAAFASTSPNLVAGDDNGVSDVFIRRLDPPHASLAAKLTKERRPVVQLKVDDPLAGYLLCQIDRAAPFLCAPQFRMPALPNGLHTLRVRASGKGMLIDNIPLKVSFRIDSTGPKVTIRKPTGKSLLEIRGTAKPKNSPVTRVEVAVTYLSSRSKCSALNAKRRFVRAGCTKKIYVGAKGARSWRLRLPKRISGPIAIWARGFDKAGNRGSVAVRRVVLF